MQKWARRRTHTAPINLRRLNAVVVVVSPPPSRADPASHVQVGRPSRFRPGAEIGPGARASTARHARASIGSATHDLAPMQMQLHKQAARVQVICRARHQKTFGPLGAPASQPASGPPAFQPVRQFPCKADGPRTICSQQFLKCGTAAAAPHSLVALPARTQSALSTLSAGRPGKTLVGNNSFPASAQLDRRPEVAGGASELCLCPAALIKFTFVRLASSRAEPAERASERASCG